MNETAIGASLAISSDVLNKITEAEVRIKKLEETTITSADKITKSFRSIGDLGVQYFIDKLKLAQTELEKFGGVNVKSSSNAFGALSNNAAAAAASVTQAAVSMSQFGERLFNTKKNLAELTEERKTLTKELTKGEGVPLKDQQRWVDELEKVNLQIKEQMKGAVKLSEEYAKSVKAQQAEDSKRYQAWLSQKDSELKEHIRVENEKFKRTKAIIDEQLKIFAELEKKKAEWAKQNASAKESGDITNTNVRAQEKMYQEMFDKIAAIEKKKNEEALLLEQKKDAQLYKEWLARKDAELKKHKQVEDEKYKTTVAVIEEQKKKFAELEKQQANWLQQNASAKGSGERVNREIREQEKAYERMFDEITRRQKQQAEEAIALARRQYAEQSKLYQQKNLKQNTTYQGALDFAENANTINRRTKAIQYLTQARAQLSTTDANYTQKLRALNDAIKKMNAENERAIQGARNLAQQHSNLMNTSDQLMRKLALVFSVSQIQGYVNKLIQVRGEFELQNTALASILQNKDQADKLFGQITELAVKSPFTVKELTTYTKSLAAYQFQYEELYDTTKRLADVASGLGVDMQRLILAVGQVKAAGYLRGTEARQFTEAGFNILGELAKYYSELENRIVSVGEVQERQFKRMIAYQDVEEVFKRVTEAGGIFYQIQEKQAETLAGQMSNLQDSIDIMLNDIGKANDATLKNAVTTVRDLVENWRDIAAAISFTAKTMSPFIAYMILAKTATSKFSMQLLNIAMYSENATKGLDKISTRVANLATKLKLGSAGAKIMMNVLGGLATLGVTAVIAGIAYGITTLYVNLTKASREAELLKKSLTNISSEGFVRAAELSRTFETLANNAVKAADGSKEQQDALAELNRTYKDIIPEEQLRIESLRALKGEYESVTTAIYSKIQADIKEKQIQEVGNTYGKDFANSLDALSKKLSKYNMSLDKSRAIVEEFRKEIEKETIETSTTARKYLEDLIAKATEATVSLTEKGFVQTAGGRTWGDVVIGEIGDVLNAYTKFSYEVDKINKKPIQFFNVKATPLYSELKTQFEEISKFKEQWDEQNKDKFSLKVEFNEESKNALIAQYQKFIQDIQKQVSSGKIQPKDLVSANLVIEEAQNAIKKLDVSPQIAQVNDLRVEFSKLYNIDFEKFNFTKMLEGQGFNDFIKRLDEGIKDYEEVIEVFDEATKQGIEVPAMQQWALLQGKTIEEIRAFVPVLKEYRKELALVESKENKKGGRDNTEQIFKQRLEFFERANSEYEKLLKNYSKEAAKAKILKSMQDEASQRGVGGIFMSAEFDEKGTLKSLDRVKAMYKSLSEDMRIEFAKAFGGIELDMDVQIREDRIKTVQDQFSLLFGNYELSLELDKLGLDKNLASQLFGVDVFDLSGLRKAIEPFKDELENTLGTEGVDAWNEMNKKISQAEAKELQDRLKTYSKYLKKSVSERVAIEMEAQKKIAEVRATQEFTPGQQERIVTQIKQETQVKKDKQSWKEFQDSELYIKMFEDLEYASTKALDAMEQKLIEVRSSLNTLSPTELKQINDQLEKIREVKISRNPFEGLKDNIKGYIEYLKKADELNSKFIESQEKETDLKELYDMQLLINQETQKQYANLVKNNQENSSEGLILKEKLNQQDKILDVTLKQLVAQEKITKETANQIRAGEQLGNNSQKQINSIGSTGSQIVSSIGEITGMLENFGVEFGETFDGVLGGIGQAFAGLEKIDLTKPMSIISGAVSVVSGIGNAFASIFGFGNKDKQKEREIQRQIEQVEKLQKAYEKLEEAIDNAYSIDTLKSSKEQSIENLKAQNEAFKNSIAAEQAKKKTDHGRIQEWEQAIEDNLERIQEMEEEFVANLGGFGSKENVKSAAQEFADAWLDAYMETGDGLDALNDKWDEYIKNVIAKQLMLEGTKKFLQPVMNMLDGMLKDATFTSSEAESLQNKIDAVMPQLNEFWKSLAGSFDLEGLKKGDTMSGLQRGIQSVTEETAQALEALLNSVRYFTSDSNMQLKNILTALTAPSPENPYLLELKAQTEQLRLMNNLWNGIIKNGTTGKAINVRII